MEGASKNLMQTAGRIEYELALSNMAAKRFEHGIELYKLAASHDNANALFNLGVHLQLGLGVEKNPKFAYECFKRAASLGHDKAMHNQMEYEKGYKRNKEVGLFSQRRE